eukprot:scaffold1615_cov208-Pinguiococcus_pyrenoidosus.AAC.1
MTSNNQEPNNAMNKKFRIGPYSGIPGTLPLTSFLSEVKSYSRSKGQIAHLVVDGRIINEDDDYSVEQYTQANSELFDILNLNTINPAKSVILKYDATNENTVRELSRHLQRPTKIHLQMAKRTLRYLRGTLDRALRFGKGDGRLILDEVYSDATWNSDYTTSRSVTGYMLFVNGTSVTWKSVLQPSVSLSSAESEYMALAEAAKEVVHIRSKLAELGHVQYGPTVVQVDNIAAGSIARGEGHLPKRKHIRLRHRFVEDLINDGTIAVRHVPTDHQVADLLTKSLGVDLHRQHCMKIWPLSARSPPSP